MEQRLPAGTRGYISFPRVPEFVRAWENTCLGTLWNDPAMKPFCDDVRSKLARGRVYARWTLGFSFDDLTDIASGELALAVIDTSSGPGLVLLADVAGKEKKADGILKSLRTRLALAGAQSAHQTIAGVTATVYELPAKFQFGSLRQVIHLRKGSLLVAASSASAISAVLERGSSAGESLADREPFRETTGRATRDLAGAHVRWFVEPIGLARAIRDIAGARPAGTDYLRLLQQEGFGALQGVGGAAVLATTTDEISGRMYVHAPGPYRGAMRLLNFPDVDASEPPTFVPDNAAGFLTLSVDWRKTFETLGDLFDRHIGGRPGVFEAVIRATRDARDGPRVDLRRDVIGRLDNGLWIVSLRQGNDQPLNWLHAVRVRGEKPFAKAIHKLCANDTAVRSLRFGEHGMLQLGVESGRDRQPAPQAPAVLTIHHQHLLVAQAPSSLRAVERMPAISLADGMDADDMLVSLKQESSRHVFLHGMFRNEEIFRETFRGLRDGTKDSKAPLSRALRATLPAGLADDACGTMKKLPEFDKLRRKPAGTWLITGVNRPKGWLVIVQLPRQKGGRTIANEERVPWQTTGVRAIAPRLAIGGQ